MEYQNARRMDYDIRNEAFKLITEALAVAAEKVKETVDGKQHRIIG